MRVKMLFKRSFSKDLVKIVSKKKYGEKLVNECFQVINTHCMKHSNFTHVYMNIVSLSYPWNILHAIPPLNIHFSVQHLAGEQFAASCC